MTGLSSWYVSVDPGSVHCGWATWVCRANLWTCTEALELSKQACEDRLLTAVGIEGVAIEGFWLRPDLANQQIGSAFGEVEVIGVARAAARRAGIPLHVVTPTDRDATLTRLKAAGYRFKARGNGPHAADAEAVLPAALRLSVRVLEQLRPA